MARLLILAALLSAEAMFALGVALLAAVLLRRWSRYYRRQKRNRNRPEVPDPPRQWPRTDLPLVDAPTQATRWQVEMHDVARTLKGELDTKMVALQTLIRMAGQEAERLEQLIERCQRLEKGDQALEQIADGTALEDLTLPAPAESASGHPGLEQRIYQLARHGHSPQAIAEQLAAPLGEVELLLSVHPPQETRPEQR